MELSDAFHRINALTQEQRDAAYDAARKRIAGEEPTQGQEPMLRDFKTGTQSKYPRSVTSTVLALCVVFLLFAFIPSAQRIHAVAIATNLQIEGIMQDANTVYVAGLSTVLAAEIAQVLFSITNATIDSRQKRGLAFGSYIGLAIAISGNFAAMGALVFNESITFATPFKFLEMFAPPVLVLITASALKSQMLNAIERHHHATEQYSVALELWKANYANAVNAWRTAYQNASQSISWDRTLANTLRDAIRNANRQSKAVLRELTQYDWHALVIRERKAEEWYDTVSIEIEERKQEQERLRLDSERLLRSGNSTGATGEVASAKTLRVDGAFVKVCPECGEQFMGEAERQATNKLVAHMKKHRNQERKDAALVPIAYTNGNHVIAGS